MKSSGTSIDLDILWEAAQRVRAVTGTVTTSTNETVRVLWKAIDAELAKLGIPIHDHRGPSGPGRAWWTAQNEDGRITGIWAESYEEAVIDLGYSWNSRIVWCIADTDLRIRNRYPRGKQGEACIRPVTTEPIPGPDFAPLAPLF